uniref:Lipocalin n=1 Tax=Rhipicephalus appendiculatus TaxID=34631 RepID=A0A131Z1J3_RHIAP
MAKGHIFGIFLFATCAAVLECRLRYTRRTPFFFIPFWTHHHYRPYHHRHVRKPGGFEAFLSSGQPIWTYKTTGRPFRQCEVEQVIQRSQATFLLMRSYYDNNTKITANLQGRLQPRNVHRMLIQRSGTTYHEIEDIVHLSKKLRCAVVKVTSTVEGMRTTYDLRVRNSSIIHGPSRGCNRAFWRFARGAPVVYVQKCQEMLRSTMKPEIIVGAKKEERKQLR